MVSFSAQADCARLTPSLVVADFQRLLLFFQTGHGLFIQQRRRERCPAVKRAIFNAASKCYRLGGALLFLRRLFLQGLRNWLL